MGDESWRHLIEQVFVDNRERLQNVSLEIWSHPELGFEEIRAHDLLTGFLIDNGFKVEKNFVTPTGFRASYSSSEDANLPHVCFICEYDAIPEMGHGSGHNLSTMGSLAAALAVKKCLQSNIFAGKVTVLGTPAEDCGGGIKHKMLNAGALEGVQLAALLYPMNVNAVCLRHYTLLMVTVQFTGKAAHASIAPWEGKNALDAAVTCYTNIGLMRQQLKPNWFVNGVITKGGVQPNVIPHHTELRFWLRAPDHPELCRLQQKCTACFMAAAKTTGCEVNIYFDTKPYYPMMHSKVLCELFDRNAQALDMHFGANSEVLCRASTDMGNVSQVISCLCPGYNVGGKEGMHYSDLHEVCGTPEAHENTFKAAKALAFTTVEVISNKLLLTSIQAEHKQASNKPINLFYVDWTPT